MTLAQLLAKRGIAAPELARELGMHPSTIQLWVTGKRKVPKSREHAIAGVLGMTRSDLADCLEHDDETVLMAAPVYVQPEFTIDYELNCIPCGRSWDARWSKTYAAVEMTANRLRCPDCRSVIFISQVPMSRAGMIVAKSGLKRRLPEAYELADSHIGLVR